MSGIVTAGALVEDDAVRRNEAFKDFVLKSSLFAVCVHGLIRALSLFVDPAPIQHRLWRKTRKSLK